MPPGSNMLVQISLFFLQMSSIPLCISIILHNIYYIVLYIDILDWVDIPSPKDLPDSA